MSVIESLSGGIWDQWERHIPEHAHACDTHTPGTDKNTHHHIRDKSVQARITVGSLKCVVLWSPFPQAWPVVPYF